MSQAITAPSPEARAVIEQEEAILARVREALATARERPAPRAEARDATDAVRALRDEAVTTSVDDLPALLLELHVRQKLRERPAVEAWPDPRCPYLAHLVVDEGKGPKDYLLGQVTFLAPAAGVRVVDWRVAPVAQIFYRHREGDAYEEELPGRVAEGLVVARRVVVIEDGVLTRILGDGLTLTRLDDGRWTQVDPTAAALATGGAGAAARPGILGVGAAARPTDVTALLDPEQYAAVCAPPEEPLLVLGTAGSGKTTVALHRLARITAREPARFPLSRARVIVPEEGLAQLSRRLLEPLGVGAAQVETLDAWALALTRQVFGKAPRLAEDPPALVTSLKRHPALYHALRERFARLAPASTTLRGLRRRLADVLTDRAFLGGVVAASGGTLPAGAIEETVRHTLLQLAEPVERQLASITDAARKQAVDGRAVAEGTPDALAGTVDAEDLPILLFLKAWRAGLGAPSIAHLVLDEAEDFSLFELFVLGQLLDAPRSVTLSGDEAQQTSSSFAGWRASLATLGVGDAPTCRLAVSYRCPGPVAALARRVLGALAPEAPTRAARDGAPVGVFHFPEESQAHLFLAGAVRDLLAREPRASIAVIARSAETARRFHALVAEVPEARLSLRGELPFEPGLDVAEVDEVKGLEFDYVIVPDATAEAYPATDEARRRLHVAVTRASHQLWLVSHGARSPLLAAAAPSFVLGAPAALR
jgi:DNA helicase IV